MENMEINIGNNLKLIRKSLKLTQSEFANKIEVSRSCVQHWETNYTEPSIQNLRKMKEVFNISYDEIIDGI